MTTTDTLSAASLNMLLWVAGQKGADPDELRQALGLPTDFAARPDARVPIATMQRLWPLAVAATGDACLDLHVGDFLNPAALGVVAYVLMHSPTLGAALPQLCRYQDVSCEGVLTVQQPAAEYPGGAWLTVEITSPDIIHREYVFNSELALYLAVFRSLTDHAVVPQAVHLAYPRPAEVREHERIFGTTNVMFNAKKTALAFDAATLSLPLRYANPELLALFEQHAEKLLAQLPSHRPATLPERVRQEIVQLIKQQAPTLAAVADRLCLSTRTLQLHLKTLGHSYQQVLDEVRCELAQRHLREDRLSTTDVAFLLGYAEPSVFVRSFKKWTGLTPGAFRG